MVFSAIRSGKSVRAAASAITPSGMPMLIRGLFLAIVVVLTIMAVAMVAFLRVGL